MKTTKIAIALILTSTSVFATGNDNDGSANANARATSKANSNANSSSYLRATIYNDANNSNSQEQYQNQSTQNSNSNTQSISVGGSTSNFESSDNHASSAYAPNVYPTAPCMGSTSGGAQTGVFGFSIGATWESKDCMMLETARSFEQAGYREDALAIRCKSKYAKDAPSCKALDESGPPL